RSPHICPTIACFAMHRSTILVYFWAIDATAVPIVLTHQFRLLPTCARISAAMAFPSPSRATILVVDDDSAIRDSLHLILEDEYEVIDAIDGCEALAILASRKIDLVLLDLVMSGADGFDVLSTLGKVDPLVPIVVVSALNTAW